MFSSLGTYGVVEEIFVGKADTVFEFGLVGPAEGCGFGYIQQFARGAIRTGGIPFDTTFVADDFCYQFCQLFDSQFLARTGVDGLVARIVVHQEHTQVRQIVHIEELTQRRTIPPTGNAFRPTLLGFVETTNERRQHM